MHCCLTKCCDRYSFTSQAEKEMEARLEAKMREEEAKYDPIHLTAAFYVPGRPRPVKEMPLRK